jgi:hypothetical protein
VRPAVRSGVTAVTAVATTREPDMPPTIPLQTARFLPYGTRTKVVAQERVAE